MKRKSKPTIATAAASARRPGRHGPSCAQAFVIEEDSTRFPKSGGWGCALFNYGAKADKFTVDPGGVSDCGHACHVKVKKKDRTVLPEAWSRACPWKRLTQSGEHAWPMLGHNLPQEVHARAYAHATLEISS